MIITDPYNDQTGLKLPKLKGDVVLISDRKSEYFDATQVEEGAKVFDWPGEYEVKDVPIISIDFVPKKTEGETVIKQRINIFQFSMDEVKVCFLGCLANKLTDEVLEEIGDVDVLLVPVGDDKLVLDAKKAHDVVEQIEPAVVIPMFYKTNSVKLNLGTVEAFAKEVGLKNVEPQDSFKLIKKDMIEGRTEFVVLKMVN